MTKKLEKLTTEQEQILEGFADKWIDRVYATTELDKPTFEKGLKWLYSEILNKDGSGNISNDPTVVYCDSVEDTVKRAAIAYHKTDTPTEEQLTEMRKKASRYISLPLSSHWVASYDYYHVIGVVDHENFKKFRDFVLSGVYTTIEFEKACFVCLPPVKYVRGDDKLLHNEDGYAIEFRDGTGFYYLQGRLIPHQYYTAIRDNNFTLEDFISIKNEEHKSACILAMQNLHDETFVADFFKKYLSEVDTFVDKKADEYLKGTTVEKEGKGMNVGVYTLFKGTLEGQQGGRSDEPVEMAYVRCYCPSTDRMFFLGCEPHHTNAKDAIASLYRVPSELKGDIKYIQRQGEIFSTVFTEAGKGKLKQMTAEQRMNTTTISGDEYFKLMRYEY